LDARNVTECFIGERRRRHRWKPSTRLFVFVIASILLLTPVGHAKETITIARRDARRFPAKPDRCEIETFQDGIAKPTRPYVEIAVFNYHDERHRTKDGALKLEVAIPKLSSSACKLGADALIDIRITEVRRLEFAMFNVRATAVRFDPEGQTPASGVDVGNDNSSANVPPPPDL